MHRTVAFGRVPENQPGRLFEGSRSNLVQPHKPFPIVTERISSILLLYPRTSLRKPVLKTF
jgi:hypothetical protein